MVQIRNYRRFYAVFNKLDAGGDRESSKETLVSSFTGGRTTSLKEMTADEYNALCASLEERSGWRDELKRHRSSCLRLMQKAGVDTTDWVRVNALCRDPRIAGKDFARLGIAELEALAVKLRAINRKGGFRPTSAEPPSTGHDAPAILVPLSNVGDC